MESVVRGTGVCLTHSLCTAQLKVQTTHICPIALGEKLALQRTRDCWVNSVLELGQLPLKTLEEIA